MTPDGPTPLSQVSPIESTALEFAKRRASDTMAVFRHRSGRTMVYMSVGVLFVSHFAPLVAFFTPEFPDRAWFILRLMFFAGLALAGPDAVEGFVRLIASLKRGKALGP